MIQADGAFSSPPPVDREARQTLAGEGWADHHRLFFVDDDGGRAVAMQIGIGDVLPTEAETSHDNHRALMPGRPSACFHCVVFQTGGLPVVIVDDDIAVPDDRWEFRTSGLWADNICETPYRHWSYGLEAFGLAIDEPREMMGRGYGQRVPLGWEFDFEGAPEGVDGFTGEDVSAYSQTGRVDGLLLFGDGSFAVAGTAVRQHWWGKASLAPWGWLDAATAATLAPAESTISPGRAELAGSIDSVVLPLPGSAPGAEPGPEWIVGFDRGGLTSRTARPDPQR